MTAQNINAQITNPKITWSAALSDKDLDLVAGGSGSGKATTSYPYANRLRIVGTIATEQAWW